MIKNGFILMLLMGVLVVFSACDGGGDGGDGDADSDTDTDTDTDTDSDSDADTNTDSSSGSETDSGTSGGGDFPGDCACAARFDFGDQRVDICSNDESTCLCMIKDNGSTVSCYIQDVNNSVSFFRFVAEDIYAGASYNLSNSMNSTFAMGIDDVGYSSAEYDVFFEKWDGIGGITSGTFVGSVSANKVDYIDITNGQFYAPIFEE